MYNSAVAHRTLDYIREHPDEWNQGSWNQCFAGITVKLAGYTIYGEFTVIDSNGVTVNDNTPNLAKKLLGLDSAGTFADLCWAENTLMELEQEVNLLDEKYETNG